ncbi:MAG: AmmeMemoRadiSam system protein B [Candidatus Omnitrophota bacterium]
MGLVKIRKASVAGQFYPATEEAIRKQIESLCDAHVDKTDCIACMLPHAGYIYSGRVACETVSRISIRDSVLLLGPNHTGFGPAFSIMTQGTWQTPLGEVDIDADLAGMILKDSKYLESDTLAHAYEHSLEVELPILQYFKPHFLIVPMVFLSDDLQELKGVGEEIAQAVEESGRKDSVLVVASSDMTHYEPKDEAQKKDKEAIEAILKLDENRLMEKTRSLGISMCGVAPTVVMLTIAKRLGAHGASLIKYQTSADATGDAESVVGYAGIIIRG